MLRTLKLSRSLNFIDARSTTLQQQPNTTQSPSSSSSNSNSNSKRLPKVEVNIRQKTLEFLDAGQGMNPIFVKDPATDHPSTKISITGNVRFFTSEVLPVTFVSVYLVGSITFDMTEACGGGSATDSIPSLQHTFYASEPTILWPVNAQGVAVSSKQNAVPLKTLLDFNLPFPFAHAVPSLDIPGSASISWSVVACVALKSAARPSLKVLATLPPPPPIPTSPSSPTSASDTGSNDKDRKMNRRPTLIKTMFSSRQNREASPSPSRSPSKSRSKSRERKHQDTDLTALLSANSHSATPLSPPPTPTPPSPIALAANPIPNSTIASAASPLSPLAPSPQTVVATTLQVPSFHAIATTTIPDASLSSQSFRVRQIGTLPRPDIVSLFGRNKAVVVRDRDGKKRVRIVEGAVAVHVVVPQPMVLGSGTLVEVNVDVVDLEGVGLVRGVKVALVSSAKFDIESVDPTTLHPPNPILIDTQRLTTRSTSHLQSLYHQSTPSIPAHPQPTDFTPLIPIYTSTQPQKIHTPAQPSHVSYPSVIISSDRSNWPRLFDANVFLEIPRGEELGGRRKVVRRDRRNQTEAGGEDDVSLGSIGDAVKGHVFGPSMKTDVAEITHHLRVQVFHDPNPNVKDPFSDDAAIDMEDDDEPSQTSAGKKKRRLDKITVYIPVRVVQACNRNHD
ncbi:hypothetical protein HDU97_001272 [Phlyctochytrium planicorne]|nr:hypothetical protein HDU97_001272 [Phlyctochytrium planicorne]